MGGARVGARLRGTWLAGRPFETAYDEGLDTDGFREIPGAANAIERLRSTDRHGVLTTGFSPSTPERVLHALGWHDLITPALSPADAGRGRLAPDMLLTALLRTVTESVHHLAAAGDTTSDLLPAHHAGARITAAVRTGSHTDTAFATIPHTHILDCVTDLPAPLNTIDAPARFPSTKAPVAVWDGVAGRRLGVEVADWTKVRVRRLPEGVRPGLCLIGKPWFSWFRQGVRAGL
ncbi:hypothetical protein ACWGN5_26825 [Streptomyces sp. NPDC055815]